MDTNTLITESLSGNKRALEKLIATHQNWIYNIAINLTNNTTDADDLTQETLIKAVTNLSSFQFKSEFKTWLYRILKNTFLNSKRNKNYTNTISWEEFGANLNNIKDENFDDQNRQEIITEAKLSCMKAMLLCLNPEERLIYIIGDLFEFPDRIGADIMEISKSNFRKKLSRTRANLYNFMNHKCGLVNSANPCRCAKKTKGFIKAGYVNPNKLQFQKNIINKIENVIPQKLNTYENENYIAYQKLFQNHYFQSTDNVLDKIKELLASKSLKNTFDL